MEGLRTVSAEQVLEWEQITTALEKRAVTVLGKQRARGLCALGDRKAVERSLQTVEQLRVLRRSARLPHLSGVEDIREVLRRAEKEGVLLPAELIAVGRTLDAIARIRSGMADCAAKAPLAHALIAELGDHLPMSRAIAASFDDSGEISDDASADLGQLRRKASNVRVEIKGRLGELLSELEQGGALQDSYYTQRGDRYVVPVRSDRKGEVQGIVHDASNSGQTLFVEPQAMVDLGNRLKIAEAAVREEELRILVRLTTRLVDHATQLREDLEAVAELDSYVARAKLADDLDCEVPAIAPDAVIDLRAARHPTLVLAEREARGRGAAPRAVVANDIGIASGASVLVISGPNAGGKTVGLKTVGLCALMLRAGLPIPASERSTLTLFDHTFAVIGDDQSIAANLSTFSAHVLTIDAVVRSIRERGERRGCSLCLIDEIAQGTDPAQGACMAQAFLEALADLGVMTIATTHFDRLKALALDDPRFRNASVALDPESLAPDFRIHPDVPGASSAFAIAANLGVQASIVDRARALAGPEANRLEGHLADLASERDKLARARTALEVERAEARAQREQLEAERERVRQREQDLKQQARESLLGDVRKARREVAEIIAEVQRGATGKPRQADRAAHRLKDLEGEIAQRLDADKTPGGQGLDAVHEGMAVFVPKLRQEGQVVEVLKGGRCVVQCGGLRTRVRVDELRATSAGKSGGTRTGKGTGVRSRARSKSGVAVTSASVPRARPLRTTDNTLDLRGQRVDEALDNCTRFFDAKLREQHSHVYLLHGHGTGALRQALRQELPASPYVQDLFPAHEDDGGDAFTVVELG